MMTIEEIRAADNRQISVAVRAEVERLISANQTLRNAATCTSVELAVENSQLLNEVERLRREGVGKYMCACDGLTVATCSGCGNPKVRP